MNAIMAARITRWVKLKTPSARSGCSFGVKGSGCSCPMVGTPDNALEHRNQNFPRAYDYQIREVA